MIPRFIALIMGCKYKNGSWWVDKLSFGTYTVFDPLKLIEATHSATRI